MKQQQQHFVSYLYRFSFTNRWDTVAYFQRRISACLFSSHILFHSNAIVTCFASLGRVVWSCTFSWPTTRRILALRCWFYPQQKSIFFTIFYLFPSISSNIFFRKPEGVQDKLNKRKISWICTVVREICSRNGKGDFIFIYIED